MLRRRPPRESPTIATFDRVYTAEFGFVWRTLRRFGVPRESLEDAAQEVFIVWIRRGDELGRRASARTCLFGIARRVAADTRRRTTRAERRHEALATLGAEEERSPERAYAAQEATAAVGRALHHLPATQRAVLELAVVEGLSAREIGELLEISPNTASSRLRLARQRLATAVGGDPSGHLHREEPPAEARARVWVGLVPVWEGEWIYPTAHSAQTAQPAQPAQPAQAAHLAHSTQTSQAWNWTLGAALVVVAAVVPAWIPADSGATPSAASEPATLLSAPAAASVALAPRARFDEAAARTGQRSPEELETAPPPPEEEETENIGKNEKIEENAESRPVRPREAHRGSARASASASASASAPAPGATEDPLAREARQIAEAQQKLRSGAPKAALAVLDEHAASTPRGLLADEREALRAAALCAQGDYEAGHRVIARRFPGRSDSPTLAQARTQCGD